MDNNAQKQRLLEQQSDSHGVQASHKSSDVNAVKQDRVQSFQMQGLGKQYQQHRLFPQSSFPNDGNTAGNCSSPVVNISSQSFMLQTHYIQKSQGPVQIAFSDLQRLHNNQQRSGHWQLSMHNDQQYQFQQTATQKKMLQAHISSLSKKQKVSGAFSDQSIKLLNNVTAVSGVNLWNLQQQHSKMEVRGTPLDMISSLPPNIIQTVLTLMPIRDAFRTCILSQNWRDHCLNIPKLVFDDAVFQGSARKAVSIRWKLLYIVYPILLLHQCPILEFSLCSSQLISCYEIDKIILNLSRSDSLTKLTLCIGSGDDHKLLPAFFKFQQLTVLKLQNCVFQPPVTFKGFSRLVSLSFNNVRITPKVLLQFISNCPQLKDFTLISDYKHLMGCCNSDFVALFKCLPMVEHLCMSCYPIKCFALGIMSKTVPTSLVHIKYLHLQGLSFARIDLQFALILVTNTPYIETIKMEMQHNLNDAMSQTAMNLIYQQDCLDGVLDHLRVINITNFANMKTGTDFVKRILAKSPMLKIVDIVIEKRVNLNSEVQMLKELLQYPRASAKAEIRFKRP